MNMNKDENVSSVRYAFEREAALISDGNNRFPGFYQCKNRIRFALAPDFWNPVRHYYDWDKNLALKRAVEIYYRLPAKPSMLRLEMYPSVRYARNFRLHLSRLCKKAGLGEPAIITHTGPCVLPSLNRDCEEGEGTLLYWWLTPSFRPGTLFRELLFSENILIYHRIGAVDPFFIDCINHVIYHPYDEGGVDVTALDAHTIFYLYRELNDWILDFDRERTDRVFAGMDGSA